MRFRRRNPAQATIREAIEYLASACDGAVRRDGHGFNREHVALGHQLARKRRWSRRDSADAMKLVRFYRRQLQGAGISHSSRFSRRSLGDACWAPDPTLVHRLRYWDGSRWTALVM